ncbi:MAG TPA: glucose-6-phosphate isomerase family protein [Methanoregula sp.]|nr:glucose-6-phosphate isomerase family protein [Methanoregula sp.]
MFGWDGDLPGPAVRTMAEMRPVLADPSCGYAGPLYFMYRDLAKSDADWTWLHRQRLRYDMTVIPPADLCGEWVKTKGHYHPENPAGVGYPEIYEVIGGKAHYLLQSRALDDVVVVPAGEGDIVIIPPGYGHITINPTEDETLVMANIVSTAFASEYAGYEQRRGAAYYEMRTGEFRKNSRYPDVPPIRHVRPKSGAGIHRIIGRPLYSLIGHADALAFLNSPEEYLPVLGVLLKD